jgi:hypothetical protein
LNYLNLENFVIGTIKHLESKELEKTGINNFEISSSNKSFHAIFKKFVKNNPVHSTLKREKDEKRS